MSYEIYEFSRTLISVLCCGISVKLADDYLDSEKDALSNTFNFSNKIGKGGILYAMLFLGLSAGFNVIIGMALFLSSYIIGMFHDLRNIFPSHLTGFQESILLFVLGTLLWGWNTMLFAIFFIFSIQLLDDFIDIHLDRLSGHRNYVQKLGKWESTLLFIISVLSAYYFNNLAFVPATVATAILYAAILYCQEAK